jgi:hypothetical protein
MADYVVTGLVPFLIRRPSFKSESLKAGLKAERAGKSEVTRERFSKAHRFSSWSVSPGKNRALSSRFPAINAATPVRALLVVLIEWNTTHGSSRFFLDLRFTLRAAAPV